MKNLQLDSIKVVGGGCWPCLSCFCSKKVVYVSDFCQNSKIIYVSKADVITDSTLRQIYAHNELYEKLCLNEGKTLL